MKRKIKRVLQVLGGLVLLVAAALGIFVWVQTSRFDESMDKVYDVPLSAVARSTDPAVIARGKHLAEATAACAGSDCHGADLGGGKSIDVGPLGTFAAPNISAGGLGATYTDAEIARLVRHGVKKDGRSVRFMPVTEINWLPDSDVAAVISYIRTMPAVDRPSNGSKIGTLGKVLDRLDKIPLDQARRVDHANVELAPPPSPTPQYGSFIARACKGCHGDHFSGGPIPGAPSSFPVPLNLTPDATGLAGWTFADFEKTITTGVRKNGKKLDPFMPVEDLGKLDDVEKHALFAYLQTLPATPFGQR